MRTAQIVFDFDGTLTQPENIVESYLDLYVKRLCETTGVALRRDWEACMALARSLSPVLAWRWGGWESCPAMPDPYIGAGVAAEMAMERAGILDSWKSLPGTLYAECYAAFPAPLRPEVVHVLETLLGSGRKVCLISNAGDAKLRARLQSELPPSLYAALQIQGDAGKFLIRRATVEGPFRQAFEALPELDPASILSRPTLLKRGRYFDALQKVWSQGGTTPASTVVCGDIWELDLALPEALGASVHLIRRAEPFGTYACEEQRLRAAGDRGSTSADLLGLLAAIA
jgi:phosphoserine phosphatase